MAGACDCDDKPPAPVAKAPPAIVVLEAKGEVETRRAGQWGEAQVGDRLSPRDAVRAGGWGNARVAIGDGGEVVVEPASEVTIGEMRGESARVRLERGRLRADLSGDELLIEVESAGSDAIAAAKSGSFSVFSDGRGGVAVATRTGEVRLRGGGGEVIVAPGERATVEKNQAPEKEQVPDSVYLKVRWPEQRMTRDTEVTVRGAADASARVDVNGVPVEVGPDGSFEAQVPLKEGRNDLRVQVTDLSERTATDESSVVVRRHAPRVKAESEGIWE
jgi:hypothetical protein